MLKFLDKLRNRSEAQKHAITLVSSTVITGAIFLVWVSVTFYGSSSNAVVAENPTPLTTASSPFADFKHSVAGAYESFLAQFGNIKNTINTSVNTYQAAKQQESESASSTEADATTTTQ